jgi:hypothetical protein
VRGVQQWFDDPHASVEPAGVWVLAGVGSPEEPTGVRDLEIVDERLHVLVGNLDIEVLAGGPEVRKAPGAHWWANLPAASTGGTLGASFVRGFPGVTRMEGLAIGPGGRAYYVSDEDDRVLTHFERAAEG